MIHDSESEHQLWRATLNALASAHWAAHERDNHQRPYSRAPDYYSFTVGAEIGWGFHVTVVADRNGHVYVGGGGSLGIGYDVALTGGYMNTPFPVGEAELSNGIEGLGASIDIGYGLGISIGVGDRTETNSLEYGLMGPQAAVSFTGLLKIH